MYEESRLSAYFRGQVDVFLKRAVEHAKRLGRQEIYCPCVDCKNKKLWTDTLVIKSHLVRRGFLENYTRWTKHGEDEPVEVELQPIEVEEEQFVEVDETFDFHVEEEQCTDFDVEELLCHVEPQVLLNAGTTRGLDNFATIEKASKDLLFEESKGCSKENTVLRTVLELMKLKAIHGWSDASFNELLDLLSDTLPKPNLLPKNTYYAKRLISPMSLGVEKIHACPNHCILYRGDKYKDLVRCPRCK